jgi:predicted nucleotidyltransferase
MQISAVYLFGSYAKNSNNFDSDIDVAVISDCFTDDPVANTLKLMKLRRKVDIRIESHPFTTAEFVASNPFVSEIVNTGIRIL